MKVILDHGIKTIMETGGKEKLIREGGRMGGVCQCKIIKCFLAGPDTVNGTAIEYWWPGMATWSSKVS